MATTLTWPTDKLPQGVMVDGYKLSQSFGVVRTPMDTGLARQRKRFSNPPFRAPVKWMMTGEQVAYFKSWLAYKAAYGGSFFSIKLVIDNNAEFYDARFVASGNDDITYIPVSGGRYWVVQSNLEIKVPLPLSEEVLDLLSAYTYEELRATADIALAGRDVLKPAIIDWHTSFYG